MKTGLTLEELACELTRQREAKRDFMADSNRITMTEDATKLSLPTNGHCEEFPLTRLAHTQLAGKLDIPQRTYDRFAEKHPDILSHIATELFKREPKTSLIRTMDGTVRAMLSDRYRCLDNYDMAEAALPELMKSGALIESCDITERKFYVKAVFPSMTAELPVPEGLTMGKGHNFFTRKITNAIVLTNSEVGCGTMAVSPGLFEEQCTNLATFASHGKKKTHLGRKNDAADGMQEFYSDETQRMSDALVWGQIRDIVKATTDGRIFKRLVERALGARQDKIEGEVGKVVEVISDRLQLSGEEQGGLLDHLVRGGEMSRYGVQWAVTRLSQDAEDYDRASELERAGGQVIEMDGTDWSNILAQATINSRKKVISRMAVAV